MGADNESVWETTSDGALLKQLFGYWPTMHDASVLSIDVIQADRRVNIVLDYVDLVQDEQDELRVRVRMEWEGVKELDLPMGELDLGSMSFGSQGDLIRTGLDFGMDGAGHILAERVEAFLMQVDPLPESRDELPRLKYR